MKISSYLKVITLLILFLLFLKIDFRIINELKCCQDDFDYYSHASTIIEDFDFDYSNQFDSKSRFYKNDKIAPIGFVGTGIFSAPFLGLGILLDNIFSTNQEILTFKKLMYSFSSVFYFFLALFLIKKSLQYNNKFSNLYLLAYFGSGLSYFAFERYSMTHVYEVFTCSLIIYLTIKYYDSEKQNNIYSFLLPFSILMGLLVRWTNYYLILIPFIVLKLVLRKNPTNSIYKDKFFLTSVLFSIFFFGLMSKLVYGVVTFSPTYIYGAQHIGAEVVNELKVNIFGIFFEFLGDILNILFTQEFGIFWFSAVIFLGFFLSVVNFFSSGKNLKIVYFLTIICFLQNFFIISIWNTTASSYGFRYLFSLIPLSIIVIANSENKKLEKLYLQYLKYFSIIGIISVLFFETTIKTQLSLVPVLNSFGIEAVYSQPEYLTGFFGSFLYLNSYLKVFATSFFGSIAFKLVLIFFGTESLLNLLAKIGLGTSNQDFYDLISKLEIITFDKFLIVIIFSALLIWFYSNKIYEKNQ